MNVKKKNLPQKLRSQEEAFELDKYELEHVDNRKRTLKRFTVELPILNNSFDPNAPNLRAMYERMSSFDIERGGLSYNTLRMMSFVVSMWDNYCKANSAYSFPIHPQALLIWYKSIVKSDVSINTIRSYRTLLGIFHTTVLKADNPNNDPIIKDYFRALKSDISQLKGEQIVDIQAKPFRRHHLNAIRQLWGNIFYPLEYRNLTLLTIAYATSLRESEICNIRKKHVKIKDGRVEIHRVSSKTSDSPVPKLLVDDYAEVVERYLTQLCSVLKDDDFIFSKMTTLGQRPEKKRSVPMQGSTVDRIFAAAHKLIAKNDDVKHGIRPVWSGHSARVGALQDAYLDGMKMPELIKLGDWTSGTMVFRYLRGLLEDESPNVTLQKKSGALNQSINKRNGN